MNKVAYKERTWQRWIYGLNPQLRRQTFNAKFLTADDNRLIIFKQSEVVGILLDVVCLVEKGLNSEAFQRVCMYCMLHVYYGIRTSHLERSS